LKSHEKIQKKKQKEMMKAKKEEKEEKKPENEGQNEPIFVWEAGYGPVFDADVRYITQQPSEPFEVPPKNPDCA
jgi:hypothetical protein